MTRGSRQFGVITNREIQSEALLEEALGEVAESALANGIGAETVAETLRDHADRVTDGEFDPAATDDGGPGPGDG
jgi:hypothetical protein